MGSSYFPISGYIVSYPATGPTGPTGNRGDTGPTTYGPTGNTGNSVVNMGICGDKLRTYFSDGSTYETQEIVRGHTGNTRFFLGISSENISIFSGPTQENLAFQFRTITGTASSSGRVSVSVGLSGTNNEYLYFDYVNRSSGLTIGITGISTINTFVGYSGSTLISIPKTIQGDSSSFLSSNVFEKARGLGFSGSTNSSGLPCNYITGGTLGYLDTSNNPSITGCQFVYIDPDCVSSNSTDLAIRNKVFLADMQGKITLIRLGKSYTTKASSITLVLMNSNNFSASRVDKKRFDVHGYTGSILWPFNKEPCFCGETGTNVYHLTNLGGNTWYGSVAYMTDPNVFRNCAIQIHGMIGLTLGACCVDNGTVGGTCSNETYGDCVRRGTRVFWHEGLTCGGSPCGKTGACSLMFTTTSSQYSTLCLNGITCIDCIAGRVYDSKGITYNPASFTYLGNGITCTSLNTPEEA
jgi:hypothetical protein